MFLTVLSEFIRVIYYIALIYYLLIAIFFIMTWFRSLYGTKLFDVFRRISSPFMNICSGRLIVGGFDLGATIGMLVYAFLLYLLEYLSLIL